MSDHASLTGADLHEPKGITGANSGDVYVADGANGGAWTSNKEYVYAEIADISTAASSWALSPIAGTISNYWTVIDTAITVGDATITLEIGGTPVTGSSITIAQSGSAAGDVDTAAPSAANTVTQGGAIEIITDGGSTDASKAVVLLEITPS